MGLGLWLPQRSTWYLECKAFEGPESHTCLEVTRVRVRVGVRVSVRVSVSVRVGVGDVLLDHMLGCRWHGLGSVVGIRVRVAVRVRVRG